MNATSQPEHSQDPAESRLTEHWVTDEGIPVTLITDTDYSLLTVPPVKPTDPQPAVAPPNEITLACRLSGQV